MKIRDLTVVSYIGNRPSVYELYSIKTFLLLNYTYFVSGYHGCLVNSIGCSHFCSIDTNGDPVCTCPDEYTLLEDGKTCACKTAMILYVNNIHEHIIQLSSFSFSYIFVSRCSNL